ncbi:MAG TPA: hypothetical protein VFP89_09705 [Propionibacteriaceae bacterium]|nr:hypothetical protein [Propionibacteriaceae bacterium]
MAISVSDRNRCQVWRVSVTVFSSPHDAWNLDTATRVAGPASPSICRVKKRRRGACRLRGRDPPVGFDTGLDGATLYDAGSVAGRTRTDGAHCRR